MIKLIIFIITGEWCNHKWKLEREVNVFEGTTRFPGQRPLAIKKICQCENCGKYKVFTIK